MPDPTQGTPAATEQAPSTQPATEQAPQVTPPAAPGTEPAAAAPVTDASAQLQDRLTKLENERTQLDQNYRQLQGAYTQSRQQLAAVTGVQPQQDPLAPMVQSIISKGITDDQKQARALAEFVNEALAPVMQGAQRANAITQSAFAVEDAMRGAVTKAPALFTNPAVANAVQGYLRQDAMNGQPINEEYALQLAKIAYADAVVLAVSQQQPGRPNTTPAPLQNFSGMWGAPGGYATPQPQQQRQISPEAAAIDAEIAARYPTKK